VAEQDQAYVSSLCVVDSEVLWCGASTGSVCVVNMRTGRLLRSFQAHTHGPLTTMTVPTPLCIDLDLSEEEELRSALHSERHLAAHPTVVWTAGADCTVRCFRTTLGSSAPTIVQSGSEIVTESGLATTAGGYGADALCVLRGHQSRVRALACVGEATLWSGSDDGEIRVWTQQTGALLHVLEGHASAVLSLLYVGERGTMWSGSYDRFVRVWDCRSGRLVSVLDEQPGWVGVHLCGRCVCVCVCKVFL
jgi:WD40 repeat protein